MRHIVIADHNYRSVAQRNTVAICHFVFLPIRHFDEKRDALFNRRADLVFSHQTTFWQRFRPPSSRPRPNIF